MNFMHIYLLALVLIMILMSLLWIISVLIKNVSIVDLFWGLGFVIVCVFYYCNTEGNELRKSILLGLVAVWGLRLSIYISWRNIGKGEDFRYREFRRKYGEKRYWWISFFQVFLLQGILMWLISAPLLGAQLYGKGKDPGIIDFIGIAFWLIGFVFEAGGDYQLSVFRSDPANKGKVLDRGFWRYTRHPNYFGDAAVWWGYGLICLSAGSYLPLLGSILMTLLIIKVSGVALLEKSLKEYRPGYEEYIKRTSAFIPWFPGKNKKS
jgi:steroid 5-alpha reductase family enzyme